MAEAERVTIRLTPDQVAAVREHGGGDTSRGVRRLVADHLGVGPVVLLSGLAGADAETRRRAAACGGRAGGRGRKNPGKKPLKKIPGK